MIQIYYAFFIQNNRIEERRKIDAANDAEAIAVAEQWYDGRPLEVWRNDVFLKEIRKSISGR